MDGRDNGPAMTSGGWSSRQLSIDAVPVPCDAVVLSLLRFPRGVPHWHFVSGLNRRRDQTFLWSRCGQKRMLRDVAYVLAKLDWMRAERIWPNGLRYLWTDAFGLVLLVSLYRELGQRRWLDEAEALVGDVERVLGRTRGIRIGEAPDRDGQYFHYLAMW